MIQVRSLNRSRTACRSKGTGSEDPNFRQCGLQFSIYFVVPSESGGWYGSLGKALRPTPQPKSALLLPTHCACHDRLIFLHIASPKCCMPSPESFRLYVAHIFSLGTPLQSRTFLCFLCCFCAFPIIFFIFSLTVNFILYASTFPARLQVNQVDVHSLKRAVRNWKYHPTSHGLQDKNNWTNQKQLKTSLPCPPVSSQCFGWMVPGGTLSPPLPCVLQHACCWLLVPCLFALFGRPWCWSGNRPVTMEALIWWLTGADEKERKKINTYRSP